jgi:integrase
MLKKATPDKPAPPYKDFPLTLRADGRYCKKIRGVMRYFGRYPDWESAVKKYDDEKHALHSGRKPRQPTEGATLADLLNRFLYSKKLAVESGDITQRTYNEYEKTCDKISAAIDKATPLADLEAEDLAQLRAKLAKGKNGKRGPGTLKGDLTRARMVFFYANETGLVDRPLRYRKPLKTPDAKTFRKLASERGPRMFEAREINAMIDAAPAQLKAMILLGINCGFGNTDCATLTNSVLDLKKGWHNHARPKTGNVRSCPLWPETVAALKEAIADRPEHRNKADSDVVFITRFGSRWANAETDRDNPISYEFRKLLVELGIYQKGNGFYSLRRTFETIGATCGEQVAVDYAMGHIPEASDMSAVYRQRQYGKPLVRVTEHVRGWLLGEVELD